MKIFQNLRNIISPKKFGGQSVDKNDNYFLVMH